MLKKGFLSIIVIFYCASYAQKNNCSFFLANPTASTIWVTNKSELKSNLYESDLEKYGAIAIAPEQTKRIDLGRVISMYFRMPRTNDQFEKRYILGHRECNGDHQNYVVSVDEILNKKIDRAHFTLLEAKVR